MGIRVLSSDSVTYLYLVGIKPELSVRITDNVLLEPVKCSPLPNDMIEATINGPNRSEFDLGIAVATLRHVSAQFVITGECASDIAANAWNSQWLYILLSALLNSRIIAYFQSNVPADAFSDQTLLELTACNLEPPPNSVFELNSADCARLESLLPSAISLMSEDRFQTAVHSLWEASSIAWPATRLAVLWAGIESILGAPNAEVSFRISLLASRFLNRLHEEDFKRVKKLYNARSKAVHEGGVKDLGAIEESAQLLNNLIVKCCTERALPNENSLLFC